MINYNNETDRIASVCRHEAQHAELYTTTTYGQLVLMMEKNALFHEKSKWVYEVLFTYMNRMQERIAVNIENLNVFFNTNKEEYIKAVENLKEKNTKYYNYFRKLCCINGRVRTEDDAGQAIEILRAIGRMALNIRIDEIPIEDMDEPKDMQRFFGEGDNATKYVPNKRFDIIINALFRNNGKNNDIEFILAGGIDAEDDNIEYIHSTAEEKAKKILKGSIIYDRLVKRIATVGTVHVELPCENIEYLMNMPIDLDRTDKANFIQKPLVDFLDILKREKYKDSIVFLQHSMGGFEDIHVIDLLDYKEKKKYYTVVMNEEIFHKVIQSIPQHIVFIQTKLFRQLKNRIRGLAQKLPIYIFIENSIYNGIEFISKNFKKGYYTYDRKGNYDVLIVWRGSYIFVSFIIELAEKELDIIFDEFEMKYISYENADIDKGQIEKVAKYCMENMILARNYLVGK